MPILRAVRYIEASEADVCRVERNRVGRPDNARQAATEREAPLPPELVDVADDELRNSITSRIRMPFDTINKLEVTLDHDGQRETLKVDDNWLKKERRRIEDEYTFQINNFGRVILYSDRDGFNKALERFTAIVQQYQSALREAVTQSQSKFEKRIVDEFSVRWKKNPPKLFARWEIEATPDKIENELRQFAQEIFESAVSFHPPAVKVLYKNVAPENLQNGEFLKQLERNMLKRKVPRAIIDSLFESGHAAPESGAFLGR